MISSTVCGFDFTSSAPHGLYQGTVPNSTSSMYLRVCASVNVKSTGTKHRNRCRRQNSRSDYSTSQICMTWVSVACEAGWGTTARPGVESGLLQPSVFWLQRPFLQLEDSAPVLVLSVSGAQATPINPPKNTLHTTSNAFGERTQDTSKQHTRTEGNTTPKIKAKGPQALRFRVTEESQQKPPASEIRV